MPSYKLMYFNGRDRAEIARMMFHLKGVEFEDDRFEIKDWPTLKQDKKLFPLGQAPTLTIDGEVMHQSKAINRYLAREFGFYGNSNKEAAQIDVISETESDIHEKTHQFYYSVEDPPKMAELKKDFKETWVKPYFNLLQDEIRKAGGKYFVGNSLTLADFLIFNCLDRFIQGVLQIDGLVPEYPDLEKFYKGIKEDSALKEYLATRAHTDF